MITHEVKWSSDNTDRPVPYDFEFTAADRDAMGRFMMPADELLSELPGANLARPELQSAMFGVLKASLIGAGMDPVEAQAKATALLHNGVDSFERAREIVLSILN